MKVVNETDSKAVSGLDWAGENSSRVEVPDADRYAPGELEEAADALLERAGVFRRGGGIYTNARLDRKIRNEHRHMRRLSECGVCEETISYLVERQVDDLVDASSLSASEEAIFRQYVSGLSCRDMAATLGIKHQAIAFRLRRAKRKVRASYREGRYAGWYEVYLSEVNRPVYRSRRRRAPAR